MSKPKNDPALHTVEGIMEALDEADGEMGIAVEYGWALLGSIYRPVSREVDPSQFMTPVRPGQDFVELWGTISLNERDLIEYLHADAERHLQPDTRYEIRRRIPANYGRSHGMAWYRNKAMDKREKWGFRPEFEQDRPGYRFIGEFTTPPR
jgi:hypothetical protein